MQGGGEAVAQPPSAAADPSTVAAARVAPPSVPSQQQQQPLPRLNSLQRAEEGKPPSLRALPPVPDVGALDSEEKQVNMLWVAGDISIR